MIVGSVHTFADLTWKMVFLSFYVPYRCSSLVTALSPSVKALSPFVKALSPFVKALSPALSPFQVPCHPLSALSPRHHF
jgi:hypothetical protein